MRRWCRSSPMCWPSRSAIRPRSSARWLRRSPAPCAGANRSSSWPAPASTTFYEVGAGKVLSGLIKRIAPAASDKSDRIAGRRRCVQGDDREKDTNVRSDRQDRAGDRRERRHRRLDRARLARAGRDGGDFRHAPRRARCSWPRRSAQRVHVLPCDLADKDEVEKLVPSAEEKMEKLDILVANAGITRDNLFVQLKDEDWDQVIAVNLDGDVPAGARGGQRHDAPPLRARHRHHLGGRA